MATHRPTPSSHALATWLVVACAAAPAWAQVPIPAPPFAAGADATPSAPPDTVPADSAVALSGAADAAPAFGAPAAPDSSQAGPRMSRVTAGIETDPDEEAVADTGEARPRAVEYSEGYGTRLEIHRIAAYAELPLFATEFILGQKLLNDERNGGRAPGGLRSAHTIVAAGLGTLFAVNTVTGVWNLWEARHDPAGRTRRTIHGLAMLVADAGFVWTATLANGARRSDAQANRHRNAAIASMSVATAATLMMWLWKD